MRTTVQDKSRSVTIHNVAFATKDFPVHKQTEANEIHACLAVYKGALVPAGRTRSRSLTMVDYDQVPKPELARRAQERGLKVETTSRRQIGPLRQDYINALEQADKDKKLYFMDLTLELRKLVYQHLLVLKDSWTCHPQILATCKQIRGEASYFLYRNNLLEVKIFGDMIQAHGQRRGEYVPDHSAETRRDSHYVTKLLWPGFLHRAQWLRVSVEPPGVGFVTPIAVNHILYSLCSFLEHDHELRSFELDIRPLGLSVETPIPARFYYPLVMLGKLEELRVHIENRKDISSENAPIDSKAHTGSALMPALTLWDKVEVCRQLIWKLRLRVVRADERRSQERRSEEQYERTARNFRATTEQVHTFLDEPWERRMRQACEDR